MSKNQLKPKKILIIGSGPIVIGQAAEFDYSGTQACLAAREERVETVLVNSNPATIQTDPNVADRVYIEPLKPEFLEKIIDLERPDGLLATAGGQTGLNLGSKLYEMGILQKYGVRFLGTGYESIKLGEDRGLFKELMEKIGQPVLPSKSVTCVEEGLEFAREIGFPIILRVAFTLGGTGGNTAFNFEDLRAKLELAIQASPIGQVLLEKSVLGWGEFEYEMLRDSFGNKLCVCNMENIDPMGVHTGESMVVAPSQTLSDQDHQRLRTAALQIVEALNIQGGCNVQFAFNRDTGEYYVIEVNPRLSRSSALASKATGYPIARVHTKIALGLALPEITNDITGKTAFFEPALDYVVVKIPRWPDDKFPEMDTTIGVSMKSTGEVMAIGRTFEEAMYKAIASLDLKYDVWNQELLNQIQTKSQTQQQWLNSPEIVNLSEKFKLSPDLVAFLAAQGVDHYVTDETELPAEKVSQLLGFNPFTDCLLLLPVGDLSLEDLAKKSVQVGKTAHGIVYNPQLDKYAITQPVLYKRQYSSPGGFVNDPRNPLGWLQEVYQELGLLPQDLDLVWPLAKILELEEDVDTVYETIFYYAETTQTKLTSSTEGEALWLSLEELQTNWSNYSANFANTDKLYLQARSLLAKIAPEKLAKAKFLQKQNLKLLGAYLETKEQKRKPFVSNLRAVLLDLEGLLLRLPKFSERLDQLNLSNEEKHHWWQQWVQSDLNLIDFNELEVGLKADSLTLEQSNQAHIENFTELPTSLSTVNRELLAKPDCLEQFANKTSLESQQQTNLELSQLKNSVWQQYALDVQTALATPEVYVTAVFQVAKLLQTAGIPLYLTSGQLPRSLLRQIANHHLSLRNPVYADRFKIYFKDYLASCRFGKLKIDPEFFALASQQLRCLPEMVLVIDSSKEVIQAAKTAGCQTLYCTDPETLLSQILPWLEINLTPNTKRLQSIFRALTLGMEVSQIAALTQIHPWFVHKLETLYQTKDQLLKQINCYKMVDTCAGEFEAKTPYFYSTHGLENEATEQLYYQYEANYDYLIDRAKKDGRELVLDAVVLNQENKVFVQKRRAERKFLPNCWGVIGGHLKQDASIRSGLDRIIYEETGWRLKRIISLLEVRDWEFQGVKKRTLVFDVEVEGDLSMPRLQLDKVNGFLWISKNELPLFYENRNYNERLMYEVCKKGLEMHNEPKKVIILGSGPIRIGQGVEFDYLTVHAVQALQKKGIKAVIINNNPETVSTDYSTSDRLYFEPLTVDFVEKVVRNEKEGLLGVIAQFGGQTAVNLASGLEAKGIKLLGTSAAAINLAEDRQKTGEIVAQLGYRMPDWRTAWSRAEVLDKVAELNYPVLLRPSFVLGGEGMRIVHSRKEVEEYLQQYAPMFEQLVREDNDNLSKDLPNLDEFGQKTRVTYEKRFTKPLLIDQFIEDAIEVDIDFISDGEKTYCFILEQLDKAGIHSGDSACVFPAQNLTKEIQDKLVQITRDISRAFGVVGIGNLQCAIKNGEIFVLEVNPRASRTVPFVSKCLGFSLTELATNVILGDKLPEFEFDLEYYKNPEYAWSLKQEVVYKEQPIRKIKPKFVAIKWPVFCLEKLPGVSRNLGPLMKSTGEAMTVGKTFTEAYQKWVSPESLEEIKVYLV